MNDDLFDKYQSGLKSDKFNKVYIWKMAIGLQAVDGLRPSKHLIEMAIRNIEGEITIREVQKQIDAYYENEMDSFWDENRVVEADKVSARIVEALLRKDFTLSIKEYIAIHYRLFKDIYKHAGRIRNYNITKKEWVLDGDTVLYGNALEIGEMLEYDFSQERSFSYEGLSMEDIIHHLALFISNLWQIHAFGEGNTRTTAVFFVKYLKEMGLSVKIDEFANNSLYFRNALARANYNGLQKGIRETTEYLELFLENLLFGKNNELHNRDLHI